MYRNPKTGDISVFDDRKSEQEEVDDLLNQYTIHNNLEKKNPLSDDELKKRFVSMWQRGENTKTKKKKK